MKAESTIRKQKRLLRKLIDEHKDSDIPRIQQAADEAYAMESVITWLMNDCDWTPISSCEETIEEGG